MEKRYNYYKLQRARKFKDLEEAITRRVYEDFNFISLDVIKNVFDNCEFGFILQPSNDAIFNEWFQEQNEENLKERGYYEEEKGDFKEWVRNYFVEEIEEWRQENKHYPMWNTLFEARGEFLNNEVYRLSDELYKVLGLGVMDGGECFNNLLFMTSAGHDFNLDYWMPLYCEILGYVNLKDYFTEEELKNES